MYANKLGIEFIEIFPGTFQMGSPEGEIGRESDESQHQVTLTKRFWVSDCQVTNAQYRFKDPAHIAPPFQGFNLNDPNYPCSFVSWLEAKEYSQWLSSQDSDWSYDLPTEAEWEYCARAGNGGRYFWGEDERLAGTYANCFDRTAMNAFPTQPQDGFDSTDGYAGPSPVRSFQPNQFGLYDVTGNVWELCRNIAYKYPSGPVIDPEGPANGTFYPARGGDWTSIPLYARLANRTYMRRDDKVQTVGFRLIARPKGGPNLPPPHEHAHVTWPQIAQLFTSTDILHMKQASAAWNPPLELDQFQSVKHYAMKIYSSVRDDRMPIPPTPTWSLENKQLLLDWIYSGCLEQ